MIKNKTKTIQVAIDFIKDEILKSKIHALDAVASHSEQLPKLSTRIERLYVFYTEMESNHNDASFQLLTALHTMVNPFIYFVSSNGLKLSS